MRKLRKKYPTTSLSQNKGKAMSLTKTVKFDIDKVIKIIEDAESNGDIPIAMPKGLNREEKREFIINNRGLNVT